MNVEQSVARHYTHGSLERTILDLLSAAGKDLDHLDLSDLAPIDEFHIGGRQATIDFAEQLDVRPGMRLLDIGSGLGGPSRYFAHNYGCRVTGIDLTEEYVRVARALARRVGLDALVSYEQGSAVSLPFAAAAFEGAYMLHVGMNIEDKARLFAEVRKVLVPGGVFGIYDVMREGEGALSYPLPWASSAETSFVASAADYHRLLAAAGFEILKQRSRRDFAIAFLERVRGQAGQSAAPPLGLHILMGPETPRKVANLIGNLQRGLVAPTEIICRARN